MRLLLGLFFISNFFVLIAQNSSSFKNEESAFVLNKGQFDNRKLQDEKIEFAYDHNPFYVFFTKTGVSYRLDKAIRNVDYNKLEPKSHKRILKSEQINVLWVGSNPNVNIVTEEQTDFYFSYAIRNTSSTTNVNKIPGFKKIIYKNLYPNIDVEYVLHPEGGIKYSIVLHPGADPSQIKMKYSFAYKNSEDDNIEMNLDKGNLVFNTSFGELIEHKPFTFYQSSDKEIQSKFILKNSQVSFKLGNYNSNEAVVIDPWVVFPVFSGSSAIWEVEVDGVGNVYSIGGESPMQLKKYNSAGMLQWTYVTPWDTAGYWLGTLSTDNLGNSYITSGTSPELQKIDNMGNLLWTSVFTSGPSGVEELWSIAFNCDESQLVIGGTSGTNSFFGTFYATIFEVDTLNGTEVSRVFIDTTGTGFGSGSSYPVEIRSIATSPNSQYVYLTHTDVGAMGHGLSSCPGGGEFLQDNTRNMDYKTEDFLPIPQNGGSLNAIIASESYFYTHTGDSLYKWDLGNGAKLNAVVIPNGSSGTITNTFGTTNQLHTAGIEIDNCGNVYVGSVNQVHKFDENLNLISSAAVGFTVYDIALSSNGELVACGAQFNNTSITSRLGNIESIAMVTCNQITTACCNANVCNVDAICETDAPIVLTPAVTGGVWSGLGVNASGVFDPSVVGIGNHYVYYSVGCGAMDSIEIVVEDCCVASFCCVDTLCNTGSSITFTPLFTGGTWSGTGVNAVSGVFDPMVAGVGTHSIKYTLSCGAIDSVNIVVEQCCIGSFCCADTVCNTASPFTFTPLFLGGTFVGVGVTSMGVFDPAVAGVGSHRVKYYLPCGAVDSVDIVVEDCCIASYCCADSVCVSDAPFLFIPTMTGGTWSGNGVNNTTGSFDPSVAGVGTHTIKYTLSCGSVDSVDVVVGLCNVGLVETNLENIRIYPNPFTTYTTIDFGNATSQEKNILISDGRGKVVYQLLNNNSNLVRIERGEMAPGIYFIEIENSKDQSKIYSGKIVVE